MGLMRGVIDPELGSDIVELGMAKGATVTDDGWVRLQIDLTTSGCPLRAQIQKDIRARLTSLPGVTRVTIDWGELTQDERSEAMAKARFNVSQNAPDTSIPSTTKVVMVASGKGGVGKSSITTNLAAALAEQGYAVGVMDADIWGFSVPRMLGVDGDLVSKDGKIQPLVREIGTGRLEVVSMGFLVDQEDSALMWRGLMLNRAVQHFCQDVAWPSDLDYLLIDMPPGTGDVQMGLAKMLPRAEMLIVTTPALNAQKVAARVADMGAKNYLRIVGVIENMSEFVAPDGSRHSLFGEGGGQQLADDIGAPLLGRVPIEPAVSVNGDQGDPAALGETPAAEQLRAIARVLAEEYVPPVEMAGCSARMLDAAMAALDALDENESSTEPACLMDEPLSNLDAKLRAEMRDEIHLLQKSLKLTMIYVTHDQTEAMSLADQVILLRKGEIAQVGTPLKLYEEPATGFVAEFIGTPPMNVIDRADLGMALEVEKRARFMGIRPEKIRFSQNGLSVEVLAVDYMGAETVVKLKHGAALILARIEGRPNVFQGEHLNIEWNDQDVHLFDQQGDRIK